MAAFELRAPLREEDIRRLRTGDLVTVSGRCFTCRSRLHRAVFDEGHAIPDATKGENLLIHAGPIVLAENSGWKLVSFMPTSSIRFEKWGARSVEDWRLRMIIGKTTMGPETAAAMKRFGCVHCTPSGVTPNLWIDSIRVLGVDNLNELGSIEATWQLELDRLGPFTVDIDSTGSNLFDRLDGTIAGNKRAALERLGIPADFRFTKLY